MTLRSTLRALACLTVLALPARAEEVLIAGTNAAGAPWSFHDAATGTERGVAVELIAEVGRVAGFRVQLAPMTLGELIPALQAKRIDIVAGNLLITPERAALVDFSDPIAPGGDGLVVRRDDAREYRALEDLKSMAVGSQSGSPFAAAMRTSGLFPDLKIYPTGTEAMRAVAAGEIAAAVVGVNGAAYDLKLGRFPSLRLVPTWDQLVRSVDAFAVRKGDAALLARINAALAALKADGTLGRVLDTYGQRGG